MALIFTAGGTGTHVAAGVMFGVSTLAMAGGQLARVGGDRTRRIAGERRDYLRHLAQIRRKARSAAADQAEALFWLHPDPRGLQSLIRTSRLWERRPTDPDFATVRLGLGDQELALDLQLGEAKPLEDVDIVSAVALRRFLRTHGTVRDAAGGAVAAVVRPGPAGGQSGRLPADGDRDGRCRPSPGTPRPSSGSRCAPAATGLTRLGLAQVGTAPGRSRRSRPPICPGSPSPSTLSALEELLSDELAGRPWASTDHRSAGGPQPPPGDRRRRHRRRRRAAGRAARPARRHRHRPVRRADRPADAARRCGCG